MRVDLNEINIFAKVVQAGSFTGAAVQLGLPKSTVSAKVSALERRLGVSLLHRTTRKLHVTPEGEAFFQACSKGLADIEAAEATATRGAQSIQGLVRVTAPIDLGIHFLPQFLSGFLTRYPKVEVELILTGRVVDIIGEGIDVAIRASALKDSSLIARKITTSAFSVFGAPSYLEVMGRPKHPRDLSKHRCIRHARTQSHEWELMTEKTSAKVAITSNVAADELSAVKQMAVAGLGIALVPPFICADEVKRGLLEPLLPEWYANKATVYVVYPAQRIQHPKVKAFVDEATELLKSALL